MHQFMPTVLVVEDEEGIRNLIVTIIRLAGFDALHCADSAEARGLVAAHGASLRLLITDVHLGFDESGIDLARSVRAANRHLTVLYISGLVDEGEVAQEVMAGNAHFLAKPFTPRTLTDTVSSIMDNQYRMVSGSPIA